jgi:hypothetical protein
MRKLARQAVVFAGLGVIVYTVASLVLCGPIEHTPSAVGYITVLVATVTDGLTYGVPTGLVVWVLYRGVRFAVKG